MRRPLLCPHCGYVLLPLQVPEYLSARAVCGGCALQLIKPLPSADRLVLAFAIGGGKVVASA